MSLEKKFRKKFDNELDNVIRFNTNGRGYNDGSKERSEHELRLLVEQEIKKTRKEERKGFVEKLKVYKDIPGKNLYIEDLINYFKELANQLKP